MRGDLPEAHYLACLIEDLEQDLPRIWGRPIESIFFGGGTPSLFSGKAYEQLISDLRARLPFAPDIEITLEANPGAIECDQFQAYKSAGINRVSLGVQSFQDEKLTALGRIHSADGAKRAIEELHKAGFERFNIDIMHGLPNQSVSDAMSDLETAVSLGAQHISWYQLTLEPNTLFAVKKPNLPEEEALADIEAAGLDYLAKQGFERYEVSAFAKQNSMARHNLNYWQFGDYVGIGAGAHAKITDVNTQSLVRMIKQKHPKAYMDPDQPYIQSESPIAQSELTVEFLLNAMRLTGGVPIAYFEQRTGLNQSTLESGLKAASAKGFVEWNGRVLKPTPQGLNFLNDLLACF